MHEREQTVDGPALHHRGSLSLDNWNI